MKKFILALIACLALSPAYAQGNSGQTDAAVQVDNYGTQVKVGEQAPDFEVEMVCGTKVKLSDFKGKVVLLNFWATWCPPCRAELARVQKEIIDRFADKEFVFLPLSRGEQKETVIKFLEENGYKFPAGLDMDGSIFKLYAEKAIPRNFLIDAEGKIAGIEIGYSDELFNELLGKIEVILKTK